MDQTKVKKASDILDEHIGKFENIKSSLQKYSENVSRDLATLKETGDGKLDSYLVNETIRKMTKNNTERVNLYLVNHAKMHITDSEVTDVIGEYKMWQANEEKVKVLQRLIMDAIIIEREVIGMFTTMIEILKQKDSTKDKVEA